jgi:hypothetical protein
LASESRVIRIPAPFVAKLSLCANRHSSCPDKKSVPGIGGIHFESESHGDAQAQWAVEGVAVTEYLDDVRG